MALIETLRLVVARPHRAGYPFIAGGLALTVAGLFTGYGVAWAGLLVTGFCLYFFRDPDRVPPARPGLVVAAADGRVVSVQRAVPAAELGLGAEPRWRVATFLSVLNVHVNRTPATGRVEDITYRAGKYLNASLDKASEHNERHALRIGREDGGGVGLIARRILCDVRNGDEVHAGDRFGLIRFGSRTDIYLPPGVRPLVSVGQTMVGGETVVAELGQREG